MDTQYHMKNPTVKPTVAIVDYGMGNLRSVAQAMQHAAQDNWQVCIAQTPEQIQHAQRIVLPGQGAMPDCMQHLQNSTMLPALLEAAQNKPLLGICVGMQMLLDHSEEGNTPTLGLIAGSVKRFDLAGQKQPDGSRYKIPQMGWNCVYPSSNGKRHPIWADIADGAWFYFLHSYYATPTHTQHSLASTTYGAPFCSAIGRDNIVATQFHPEKSAEMGLLLYRNFLHWKP